jgi:hypothetical protein
MSRSATTRNKSLASEIIAISEVIGLMPRGRFQISDHHSFLSKGGETARAQSQKSSSRAQEVSRHLKHS